MAINNRDRIKQIIDFDGLKYGTIMPTDVDGFIEYKNKAYVIIEMKHRDKEVQKGQLIAIERVVNDLSRCGKLATAFVCEHNIDNPQEDIIASRTKVRACYFNGVWRNDGKRTLKQRLDAFIRFAENL